MWKARKERLSGISIHAPTRGATCAFCDAFQQIAISIHAPTRGATRQLGRSTEKQAISIHAPTRGATVQCLKWLMISRFQSTLPRGERQWTSKHSLPVTYFNPRSHEGSDVYAGPVQAAQQYISIHAPTRGATRVRRYWRTFCG